MSRMLSRQCSRRCPHVWLAPPMLLALQWAIVLAVSCRDNVMEVFSGTMILHHSWGNVLWKWWIQTLSKHSQEQEWRLLSHDPCGWPLGGWNSKSSDGRVDPCTQDQVQRLRWDDEQRRGRSQFLEALSLLDRWWKDADQARVHHKHLGQLCKLLHMSQKLQCKKTLGHSEIENPDDSKETLCTWRFSPQVMCGYLALPLGWLATVPVRDQVFVYFLFEASWKGNGCLVTSGWIHGSSCRSMCFFEVERDSFRRLQRLPDGRSHFRDFQ